MGLAVANYHDVYECFPPPYIADENGRPMHSWRVLLLPYLGQEQLYEQYDFSESWDGSNNSQLATKRPSQYLLHGVSDTGGTMTSYLAVIGDRTAWPVGKTITREEITDGTSNTISVVENVGSGIGWMEPRDLDYETMTMTLKDDPANGISSWLQPPVVLFADGSVRTLDLEITEHELRGMLLINDGHQTTKGALEIEDGRDRPLKK